MDNVNGLTYSMDNVNGLNDERGTREAKEPDWTKSHRTKEEDSYAEQLFNIRCVARKKFWGTFGFWGVHLFWAYFSAVLVF